MIYILFITYVVFHQSFNSEINPHDKKTNSKRDMKSNM